MGHDPGELDAPPGTPGRGLKGEEGKKKGRGGEARGKGGRARVPFSAKSWGYSAFQYILPDLTPKTNRCASRFATTASALRASAARAVRGGAAEMRRKRCFPHWFFRRPQLSSPVFTCRFCEALGCSATQTASPRRSRWPSAESVLGSSRPCPVAIRPDVRPRVP